MKWRRSYQWLNREMFLGQIWHGSLKVFDGFTWEGCKHLQNSLKHKIVDEEIQQDYPERERLANLNWSMQMMLWVQRFGCSSDMIESLLGTMAVAVSNGSYYALHLCRLRSLLLSSLVHQTCWRLRKFRHRPESTLLSLHLQLRRRRLPMKPVVKGHGLHENAL